MPPASGLTVEPTTAPAASSVVTISRVERPWRMDRSAVGLVGDRVFSWDRAERGGLAGIAQHRVSAGPASRTFPIAGLNINGDPSYWMDAGKRGFLAAWDEPVLVHESGASLSVSWTASEGRWWGTAIVEGDTVYTARYRPTSAVVALSLEDGSEQWSAPLPRESQGVTLERSGKELYVQWTEYSATAPTPRVEIPLRVRSLDVDQRGQTLWTVDFKDTPGALAVADGVVIAAEGGDLHFIQGATGKTLERFAAGPPNIYPTFAVDGGRVFVALGTLVSAYRVQTGEQLWAANAAVGNGTRLAIDAKNEQLIVSLRGSELAGFSLADGKQRWRVGVGVEAYRLTVTEQAVMAVGGGGTAVLPLPVGLKRREVSVSGHLSPVECGAYEDIQVQVGSQEVKPDAEGNYTARVQAAGFLTIVSAHARTVIEIVDGQDDYRAPNLNPSLCERG